MTNVRLLGPVAALLALAACGEDTQFVTASLASPRGLVVSGAGTIDTPQLKTSSTGVTFGNGLASITTAGSATFTNLSVNGAAVPHNCLLRRVTNGGQVDCQPGEYVVGGGGDCEPGCALNHSGPVGFTANRATGWAVDCGVSGWPQTCTSVVPTSVSAVCCQY